MVKIKFVRLRKNQRAKYKGKARAARKILPWEVIWVERGAAR